MIWIDGMAFDMCVCVHCWLLSTWCIVTKTNIYCLKYDSWIVCFMPLKGIFYSFEKASTCVKMWSTKGKISHAAIFAFPLPS